MGDEFDALERACTRFYYREAELLDRAEFPAWLAMMHPRIDYRVPVRTTRDNRDGDGFSARAFFMCLRCSLIAAIMSCACTGQRETSMMRA